jgi:hypothetical protein
MEFIIAALLRYIEENGMPWVKPYFPKHAHSYHLFLETHCPIEVIPGIYDYVLRSPHTPKHVRETPLTELY